jgi:hypothetical protein
MTFSRRLRRNRVNIRSIKLSINGSIIISYNFIATTTLREIYVCLS